MDTELKQFLHDKARFKQGLSPEPFPFSRHPKPAYASPDPLPAKTEVLKVEAPRKRKMTPSQLRKLVAHLAKTGRTYTGPPPTREERIKLLPQRCCECDNGKGNAGRLLLPPDTGCFFRDKQGLRWVCHHCVNNQGKSPTSPGENHLRDLLKENGVDFTMNADIEGIEFDCHIPPWNLIVEVDSWSAHHTAAQKKKDYHRNRIAKELHIHLLRVKWNDRDMLVKVLRARPRGLALRRQSKRVEKRPYKKPVPVEWLTTLPNPARM